MYRIPVKVLHANTGALAEHFMKQMTTAVRVPKNTLEPIARSVSSFNKVGIYSKGFKPGSQSIV